jgi:hypothetical protein
MAMLLDMKKTQLKRYIMLLLAESSDGVQGGYSTAAWLLTVAIYDNMM